MAISLTVSFLISSDVGGFADIGITPKWGIQPEVLFSQVNIDTSLIVSRLKTAPRALN